MKKINFNVTQCTGQAVSAVLIVLRSDKIVCTIYRVLQLKKSLCSECFVRFKMLMLRNNLNRYYLHHLRGFIFIHE